jgi:predicted hotdog family 3-hydroxylacyl-ACP dehydratase
MLWIDEVVNHQGDEVHCRLTVRASHVFVEARRVEPVIAIEWMAQTVGALVGLYDRAESSRPRPGYLIAVPDAQFFVDAFHVGDVLELKAQLAWGDSTLASFEAQVERRGQLAARAQLSVYRRKLAAEEATGAVP